MLRNRLLLGFVAFGISFGVSWASARDVNKALVTGLTTLPATVLASVVVDRGYYRKAEARIAALKRHVRTLQKKRAEIYEAYVELTSEREQLALDMNLEQSQATPLQLPPARTAATKKPISWDLSTPMAEKLAIEMKPHELPTEIQSLPQSNGPARQTHQPEAELNQVLIEAAATKRKIEANLKALQGELNQLQSQISSHRETRDKLVQELADLKQQKRQLEAESSALRKDVDDLKRSRKELDQYLSETEKRKKDFDKGSHPLQTASKQLQAQVSTLQDELRRLEIQVSDRRKQKDDLERQLASLNIQHQALKERPVYSKSSSSEKNGGSSHHAANNGASNGNPAKELNPRPVASVATSPAVQPATQASPAPAVAKPEKPSSELSDEWNEFMGHLPEYEFLVLRAIVEQNNPAALLKKIAEDNLTMPEMLIDSINERALETVGDIIIEPGTGSGSATIAREHLRTVKRLLKTHGGE